MISLLLLQSFVDDTEYDIGVPVTFPSRGRHAKPHGPIGEKERKILKSSRRPPEPWRPI